MRLDVNKSSNGFALISVLWITAFLTVIAASVSYQARASLSIANNIVASFKTKQAAEGAFYLAIDRLIKRDEQQGYVLKKPTFRYQQDDLTIYVEMADESGKVDINLAPIDLIKNLFIVNGVNEALSLAIAAAIGDWRDQDSLKRSSGAEDQDYVENALAYEAKDDEFDSIDELSMVLGMTSEIFQRIKPYVTVYAQDLGVNVALASKEVRNAVQGVLQNNDGFTEEISNDYTTETGGLIYTVRVQVRDSGGYTTNITSIVRLQRGNTLEPFAILGWKMS